MIHFILDQWISNVLNFSSEYTGYWANWTIGPNDVFPSYGDSDRTWSPEVGFGTEFLELEIQVPVHIKQIEIFGILFDVSVDFCRNIQPRAYCSDIYKGVVIGIMGRDMERKDYIYVSYFLYELITKAGSDCI